MSPVDDECVIRDALAMIEAIHREDWEGAGVICQHGNLRLMCAMLARMAGDLIGNLADMHDADETEGLARLRAMWTSGPG